jgi:hypothetical protein
MAQRPIFFRPSLIRGAYAKTSNALSDDSQSPSRMLKKGEIQLNTISDLGFPVGRRWFKTRYLRRSAGGRTVRDAILRARLCHAAGWASNLGRRTRS